MDVSPREFSIPAGRQVRKMRKQFKMSQADLAKQVGVARTTISRIETGERRGRIDTLRDVLTALRAAERAKSRAENGHGEAEQ